MISQVTGFNSNVIAFQSARRQPRQDACPSRGPAFGKQTAELPRNFTAAELSGMIQAMNGGSPATTANIAPQKNYELCRAEHILIDTKSRDDQTAEQIATKLLNDINSGTITFEDAARKNSDCPSGESGGDLGYFDQSSMVKPFSEAAFNADVNSIVGPIKTKFGYHLIKVLDKQ